MPRPGWPGRTGRTSTAIAWRTMQQCLCRRRPRHRPVSSRSAWWPTLSMHDKCAHAPLGDGIDDRGAADRRLLDPRFRSDLPEARPMAGSPGCPGGSMPGAANTSPSTLTMHWPAACLPMKSAEMLRSFLHCEGGSLACDGDGTLIVDRDEPAPPQPQSWPLEGLGGAGTPAHARCRKGRLAAGRPARSRNGRPCGRHVLLREARVS
jgi:hypothetical protein